MSDSTFERVKKITIAQLNVKEEEVVPTASFMEDLSADSLDIIEILMKMETEFGIDAPDEETADLKTVQAVVDYVDAKLAAK